MPQFSAHETRKARPILLLRGLAIILFIWLCLVSCNSKDQSADQAIVPEHALNVFALQDIRDTGFETAVLEDFAVRDGTRLDLTLFLDLPSLLSSLFAPENQEKVDVVLGIDNLFVITDTLTSLFSSLPDISLRELRRGIPLDEKRRFLPYAGANLSILYNSELFPHPPGSFGELQDARYYTRLALCDAASSGLGRSSLLWFVSIFGEYGYEQLLNSLRKNVRNVYPGRLEALAALRGGECGLMIGYDTTPAWISEQNPADNAIMSSLPSEGSFQHVQYAAVPKDAPHRETALRFLEYLISPEAQQFVALKLGMMPVNGRAPLPEGFESLSGRVFTTNDRLDAGFVRQNIATLLQTWERKFTSPSFY